MGLGRKRPRFIGAVQGVNIWNKYRFQKQPLVFQMCYISLDFSKKPRRRCYHHKQNNNQTRNKDS